MTPPPVAPPELAADSRSAPPGLTSRPQAGAPLSSTTTTRDPYQTSPGLTTMKETMLPDQELGEELTAALGTSPPSRARSERKPVKQLPVGVPHAATPPGPTFSDKLDAKRARIQAAEEAALAAATMSAPPESALSGPTGPPPETGELHTSRGPMVCQIHNDDSSGDDVDMPPGAAIV